MIRKNETTIKGALVGILLRLRYIPSVLRAYAKINLGLKVRRKREDGYHDIETIFHRVDLYDEVRIRPSDSIRVTSTDPAAPDGPENIAYKAAVMVQQHLGSNNGVEISISKHIPVGAGLGGGSSDAALVLRKVPELWGTAISGTDLRRMALALGSDVPYFLTMGSALARGRDEQLQYFALDIPFAILLCNPGIHIPTPWAYQHVRPSSEPLDLQQVLLRGMEDTDHLVSSLVNDFEPLVFRNHPAVAAVKETMMSGGAVFALMSGSGSSVFGFFSDESNIVAVSDTLAAQGFNVFHTSPHFAPAE